MMADSEEGGSDICRVCRMEGTSDRPLYYPCICTGSIKYIHQECLTQWLKYSKKEYCELCNYKYTFMPIYHPDMPKRLPVRDLILGLFKNLRRALSYWLHYTAVAVAWLGVVPLTACRIYRCLFTGSINSILSLPLDILSTENLLFDCLQGGFILAVTLCTFLSLIWLREQIVQGDMAQWVNNNDVAAQPVDPGGGADVLAQQHAGVAPEPEETDDEGEPIAAVANGNVFGGMGVVPPDPADPPDAQQVENAVAAAQGGPDAGAVAEPAPVENEDANWQPFEWNQAADELTWERLLGLDGSLVFLEHVFWVISLNTLFILVFGFSPYHIGHFVVIAFNLLPHVSATYFEGIVTVLIGYFVIATALFITHKLLRVFNLSKTSKFLGMCYLVIKVFLLVVMEIGIFPVLCGFWLDVCSLSLFNSTMKDRVDSYHTSPGTSLFIHWLVGMVYVFYFASFVLLLREVLRPGVLWFLRNLNDPDFNPIKEMIQFPVYRHLRRFGASLAMFGVTIILIVFIPIQLIAKFCPKVLPYNISLSVEAPLSELSLELLLLQVVLPALLEQGHARQALKTLARRWCFIVGRVLDLLEYLLPAEDLQRRDRNHNVIVANVNANNDANAQPQAANANNNLALIAQLPNNPAAAHLAERLNNLAAEHQAILGMAAGPGGEQQTYRKPSWFPLRICVLLVVLGLSFLMASLLCLTVPVSMGREVIAVFLGRTPIHELYTMACGLYLSWIVLRVWVAAVEWLPESWNSVHTTLRTWCTVVRAIASSILQSAVKFLAVGVALAGVIPLALGLLFQLVIITPMRVASNQTPIFFLWQDWAMGILHCKIVCAIVMMGPDWWLKQVFERIYQDGIRNMNVGYIYSQLIIPVVSVVGLIISVPYVAARSLVPALGVDVETQIQFQRHVYPCLLIIALIGAFMWWQIVQFMRLIQHIRNDKYLVGQRLVNYERLMRSEASAPPAPVVDEDAEMPQNPEVEVEA